MVTSCEAGRVRPTVSKPVMGLRILCATVMGSLVKRLGAVKLPRRRNGPAHGLAGGFATGASRPAAASRTISVAQGEEREHAALSRCAAGRVLP